MSRRNKKCKRSEAGEYVIESRDEEKDLVAGVGSGMDCGT